MGYGVGLAERKDGPHTQMTRLRGIDLMTIKLLKKEMLRKYSSSMVDNDFV